LPKTDIPLVVAGSSIGVVGFVIIVAGCVAVIGSVSVVVFGVSVAIVLLVVKSGVVVVCSVVISAIGSGSWQATNINKSDKARIIEINFFMLAPHKIRIIHTHYTTSQTKKQA